MLSHCKSRVALAPVAMLATLLMPGLVLPCWGASGDFFRPHFSYGYSQDDNIYRVADAVAVPNGRSDTLQSLGFGVNLDWSVMRQRLEVGVARTRVRYSKHTQLDHDSENNKIHWSWVLGNRLNGTAGLTESVSQSKFEDTQAATGNLVTDRNYFVNANYRFHPRWQAILNTSHRERSNDVSVNSNSEIDTVLGGLFYRGGTLDRLGIQLRQTDGGFPARTSGGGGATGYTEKGINLVADWSPSGKTKVRARVGRVDRVNNGLSGRNYAGVEGRVEADMLPTGKLYFSGSIYRDLSDSLIINANHDLRTGASLSGTYLLTDETRVGCVLSYENRLTDGNLRENDSYSLQLNASKRVWDDSTIAMSIQRSWRESSDANLRYDATILNINATLVF